jgi:SnoaL-like domain
MTRRLQLGILGTLALAAVGAYFWWTAESPAERRIRRLFDEFATEFNTATPDGLGTVARAARLGNFFTSDVEVELGQGTAPIHGRDTLMGMAARLQPRTAGFILELDDVNVELVDDTRADVTLTALIRRRPVPGEESLDAREFAAEVLKQGGEWRISRVVAVDTLR